MQILINDRIVMAPETQPQCLKTIESKEKKENKKQRMCNQLQNEC